MWQEALIGVGLTTTVACIGFVIHLGNRVSVAESKMEAFEKWLLRVEEKLDRTLERRSGSR